jgi:hypothetical protein
MQMSKFYMRTVMSAVLVTAFTMCPLQLYGNSVLSIDLSGFGFSPIHKELIAPADQFATVHDSAQASWVIQDPGYFGFGGATATATYFGLHADAFEDITLVGSPGFASASADATLHDELMFVGPKPSFIDINTKVDGHTTLIGKADFGASALFQIEVTSFSLGTTFFCQKRFNGGGADASTACSGKVPIDPQQVSIDMTLDASVAFNVFGDPGNGASAESDFLNTAVINSIVPLDAEGNVIVGEQVIGVSGRVYPTNMLATPEPSYVPLALCALAL